MKSKFVRLLTLLALVSLVVSPVSAQTPPPADSDPRIRTELPAGLQPLEERQVLTGRPPVSEIIASATGQYTVQLADPTLSEMWRSAKMSGSPMSLQAANQYKQTLVDKQNSLTSRVNGIGGKVLATYQNVFNGLAIEIEPANLRKLYDLPGVVGISAIPEYEVTLNETVDWIGAGDLQNIAGVDGTGIRVAVIDSGIDYTHEHLGGSGNQSVTNAAFANPVDPAIPGSVYPSSKVIGGYDFVGSAWAGSADPLVPDADPIDDQLDGHGTHVASIIAGVETDTMGPGVAPGAELYALSVCSRTTTSCSGVAMLQAYDWAADPNGDSDFSDRADVINISIGSIYGQSNDGDIYALEDLVALGSVVSVSSGNSGNAPFVHGSPSSAHGVISVAQSSVPSYLSRNIEINSPAAIAGIYPATWQPWSAPATTLVTGDVVFVGTACDGQTLLANPTGKIALIDRGTCAFSQKTENAEKAGAIGVLIGLIDSSVPFESSTEGDLVTIQAFMIYKTTSDAIKGQLNASQTVNVSFDPTLSTPLPDVMMSTSSRGPAFDMNYIKPNISAPGASVSANSGDQSYSTFGGTSGAAPMIAGSAALLLEGMGGSGTLTPLEVKTLLMNNAVTETWQDMPGGTLNPITRQGAGRVDVEAAYNTTTMAWVPADDEPSLSFGFDTVAHAYTAEKVIEVMNISDNTVDYDISASLRFTDDDVTGVTVTPSVSTLQIVKNQTETFTVTLEISDPTLLKPWNLGDGRSASGTILTNLELDGFITIADTRNDVAVNLPFHFLPRKSADVKVVDNTVDMVPGQITTVELANTSPNAGLVDVFPLFEISPDENYAPPENNSPVDLAAVGADILALGPDFMTVGFVINTYESRSHSINVLHLIEVDVDQDGEPDYEVYNDDLGYLTTGSYSGVPVTVLYNYATGLSEIHYYLDMDLNSRTMVMYIDIPVIDYTWDFQVFSLDWYFTGILWDMSPYDGSWHTYDAGYSIWPEIYSFSVTDASSFVSNVNIGTLPNPSSQIGLLYVYSNGVIDREVDPVVFNQVWFYNYLPLTVK